MEMLRDNGGCVADIIGNDELKEKIIKEYPQCNDTKIYADTIEMSINGEPQKDIHIGQWMTKVV